MRESQQRSELPSSLRTAEKRSRNFRSERRRKFFRTLAKHAYPKQTAYELRRLTKEQYGERTIYDWIAGRCDAPMPVWIKLIDDIFTE
jgi:hypothetical protein